MTSFRAPLAERLRRANEQRQQAISRAEGFEAQARTIGNLRGLTFVVLLLGLGGAFTGGSPLARTLGAALAFIALTTFLGLIRFHDRKLELESKERRLAFVHTHRSLRLTGKSVDLPDKGDDLAPAGHPFAADLDLFGRGSLFQRVSTAHTDFGRKLLGGWLTEPTPRPLAEERQKSIEELAEQGEFRDEFEQAALGLLTPRKPKTNGSPLGSTPDPGPLLEWLESPPELLTNPLYRILRFALPVLAIAGMTLSSLFALPNALWLVPALVALFLNFRTSQHSTRAFLAVSHSEASFLPYGTLLERIEALEVQSPALIRLKSGLFRAATDQGQSPHADEGSRTGPSHAMRRFRRVVSWYEIRHNGMLYPFIDSLLLWSLNCTIELEKWKVERGASVRHWFETIAEFEALSSLSGLLADDEDATMPFLVSNDLPLEAYGLGHPLILASKRVRNDLPRLCPGEALLITGSNMSGKSTFLRALGVNAVLGQAGGPVVAKTMSLPPLQLGTSLRVSDSLLDDTSHFFAEVKKLAAVVEATQTGETVLFLLDEVLHGTNSRERQIGARWVLHELLRRRAFGILTTHDEGLCELDGDLARSVRLFHFREDVAHEHMTFDYRLRPGPVTSGNALRLMRAVGLEVPLAPIDVGKPDL